MLMSCCSRQACLASLPMSVFACLACPFIVLVPASSYRPFSVLFEETSTGKMQEKKEPKILQLRVPQTARPPRPP
ncbi:hypothetical protein CHARACLAT_003261 [Characodon lateralis]|uniref:Secreted protein n=1 Tax=Characodon lateralis TaxID=208331 RepID=A0ABU7DHF7_9TELE|nr:hypothetical protein [Characodon lateralis]